MATSTNKGPRAPKQLSLVPQRGGPKHFGVMRRSEEPSSNLPVTQNDNALAHPEHRVPFVELLARSNFSFLQGASHPEEMTEQAIRHNYHGICITDLNGLYGVVRGFRTASVTSHFTASVVPPKDFRYRIGAELTLTDASSIAFVPLNFDGYSNLCRLLTLGKRNIAKGFSQVTMQQIRELNQGLLAFPLPPYTEDRFLELQNIFQDRLYLPVWRDLTWESLSYGQMAFAMEAKHHAQLFVTQRAFMHSPERKALFDVLTCIHHHTSLEKAEHILIQNSERYLRPLQDLQFLWRDRPDLLKVTVEIADRIDFNMSQIRYRYPHAKLPEGMSSSDYLRELTEKGIRWRFPKGTSEKILKQIEYELELIKELHYEDYFLTLHEICQFADEQGILYQGRGSAANSIVCFCLGLTSVNPEDIDLLFERFISRERKEPPDIDIDFEHERREEVIQHIYKTYDAEHAAMVCTVIRFKTRLSLRETAKVLQIPLATVNAMIRYMGRDGLRRLHEDEGGRLWEKFKVEEWRWILLLKLSEELIGFPRHLGIHTGGFLITQDPITSIVPVEKASMEGRYVIQWNKDDVNDLQLMKIDVLSLGMLTALRKALQMLKSKKNIDWNLASFPRNDKKTYDMICRAETVGVFQIESRAQMSTLPRLLPRNHYDLVIEIALVRPGPLQGGMVHPYLRRRAGLEKVVSIHPDLDKVLEKTMGVPIFQEQVMKIAVAAAGFSPGEADELRRLMSAAWRKKGTMDGLRNRILAGMKEKGIADAVAEQIYRTIEGFANYGFPESHSASFALLTYASSFLKCHHPDIFACALLNSQPMGFYPTRVLIEEAQRNGVEFLPLDIQKSQLAYELVEEPRYIPNQEHPLLPVRLGFKSLHGVPSVILERLVEDRNQNGEFASLEDLIRRTHMPRAVLTKLAASGAMTSFGYDPRHLLWQIESLSLDQQSFLWGQAKENTSHDESHLPFESNWEIMIRETEQMGYALNKHPLSILRSAIDFKNEELRKKSYLPFRSSKDFASIRDGQKIRVAGLVGITQRPPTAKGMCFITLEDEFGCMNIVITPDVYQKDRMTIYGKTLLEVQGQMEKRNGVINLKAERVFPLSL